MKFLLVAVNAKYIHSNPGIYSLAAYACKKMPSLKEHIEIAEYTINHQPEDILADIYFRKPQVIGFSCYIWNITYIKDLCVEVHKLLPDTQIWLGGPEVSYDSGKVLENMPFLTGVMIGEGEQTFLELMRMYTETGQEVQAKEKGNTDEDCHADRKREVYAKLLKIPGLAISCHNNDDIEIVCTEQRDLIDLNEIPFLYQDLSKFENRIIYYESGRGCPFRCSYCLSSIDKSVRLRDMNIVKQELQFFLDNKVSQVKFVDRTFNCNKKHAMEVWSYLLANDNGFTNFHFEIAADILDEEELSLLWQFRPGAVQLEIGVQSTNVETIKEIDRRMEIPLLRQIVKRIHDGGNIHIHLDLIAGLPYEDYISFGKSFDDVYAMHPEQLQLGFLKVLKGSKMYRKSREYGLVYGSKPPYEVLYTDWISYEEIHKLKQIEEMVEIYYNSNQFSTTLGLLIPHFSSPFAFFEKLAAYYEKMGYFKASLARNHRYQVLLSFVESFVIINNNDEMYQLFCEALTMDIYLRENIKTRPEFCADLNDFKQESRAFFQKEAAEHRILQGIYETADARTLARMTHLERFCYDLHSGKKRKQPVYCLFDYQTRNPLTNDAKVYVLHNLEE